ncbi:MAG: hypothetical protein JXA33_10980 [Anaerolineae bacterium]|nr:hypothetical protein [Anaerolineae bacterium]
MVLRFFSIGKLLGLSLIVGIMVKLGDLTTYFRLNLLALSQYGNNLSSDCAPFIEHQIKLGETALDAQNYALAYRYANRTLTLSGKFPCPVRDATILSPVTSQWGHLILEMKNVSEESLPTWLAMWSWGNHWQLVQTVAVASIDRYPKSLWAYYYLAQAESYLGNSEAVRDVYLQALDIFPEEALLHRELARWYYAHNDNAQALRWYQFALALEPDEPTALLGTWRILSDDEVFELSDQDKARFQTLLKTAYPITKYTKPDGRNFALTRYVFDEALFTLSQGVDIEWFGFWNAFDESIEPVNGWLQVNNLWMSHERLQNWAPNPRFVWDSMLGESILPRGYTDLSEEASLSDHALITEQRGTETIHCAQLRNIATDRTGLYTLPMFLSANSCYFESGWVKSSVDANAYIGYQWLDKDAEKVGYGYVASEIQETDWRSYAGLAIPPQEAYGVRVRVLNNLANGPACFSDIVLIPLNCQ